MRKRIIEIAIIFIIFFIFTCCIVAIDTICKETTGHGGKLVFDVEKNSFFN